MISYIVDTSKCARNCIISFEVQGVSYGNVLFELALRVRRTNNVVELLCLVASRGVDI